MRAGKLARSLLWVLASLSLLASVAVLDWYPTLKDLGRLRRERGDLARRIRDYRAAAASFRFPDASEEALLAACETELRRALPVAGNDDAWRALALIDTQALSGEARGPQARFREFLTPFHALCDPGSMPWIGCRPGCAAPERSPWMGAVSGLEPGGYRLASRPIVMEMTAPLPSLLAFVNRSSWGGMRLEIVRLLLEAHRPYPRAWLDCRSTYWARAGSPYAVPAGAAGGDAGLQVDPDSPWLLRPVEPLFVPIAGMRELPPAGSPW